MMSTKLLAEHLDDTWVHRLRLDGLWVGEVQDMGLFLVVHDTYSKTRLDLSFVEKIRYYNKK